jgi:hypothetical protein
MVITKFPHNKYHFFKLLPRSVGIYTNIREWCIDTFGPAPYYYGEEIEDSNFRWLDDLFYGEIYFRDNQDVTLFLLKWG